MTPVPYTQISETFLLDSDFFSYAITWLIGAMTVCVAGMTFAALFSLGRSGYRKD